MPSALRTEPGGFSTVPRRGALALVTTILGLVLLFSFRTSDQPAGIQAAPSAAIIGSPGRSLPAPVAVGTTPRPTPATPTARTPAPSDAGSAVSPQPRATGPTSASGTFTGDVIGTPYGSVQVAVVMSAGKIVDVQALQMPSDRRLSQQISQEAGPLLRSQVLRAQSANIDGVSGASYTSEGYYQSLQSALAHVP